MDTCHISASCSKPRKPNSCTRETRLSPTFQWPISEGRALFQRTGNVQRQPFGVAVSRLCMHEGRDDTLFHQTIRLEGHPSVWVAI